MIVVVDERELVKDGYTSLFGREGIPSTGFDPVEFGEWVSTAADSDLAAVEAFLIGQGDRSFRCRRRSGIARRHLSSRSATSPRWKQRSRCSTAASMMSCASRFTP